jgi:isocitrate/isopropylmalate dehydrogenase
MQAIEALTAGRFLTRDLGGTAKTVEVTDRILEEISKESGSR